MGVAALGLVLFWSPPLFVCIYLMISLLPLSLLDYLDGFSLAGAHGHAGNVVGLAWLLSLLVFALYTVRNKKQWWRLACYRPYLLLAGLGLLGALRAENRAFGVREWVHLAAPICLSLLLCSSLSSREQALRAVRHLFLIFAGTMAAGFYQLVTGTGSYDYATKSTRLTGNFGEGGEVGYAVLLLYLACFTAPMALGKCRKLLRAGGPFFGASTFLLLASQSRGPLLALACASAAMISQGGVKLRYWLFAGIVALGMAQLVPRVYSRFGGPLLSSSNQFWEDKGISANATQRMGTWVLLWAQFGDRPTVLGGRGLGFSDDYLMNVLDDPHDFYAHNPHNEYLRLLLDLGFLGPLLLLTQTAVLYKAGSRLARRAADPLARAFGMSLCGLTLAMAVTGLSSNLIGAAAQYDVFWILTGVLLSAFRWETSLATPDAPLQKPLHSAGGNSFAPAAGIP
jgi:hypothetical protein